MLRITIEEVPEATAVPRGPARRQGDMLWPEAMLKPKVKYQQAWLEGETQPNVTMLIGLLNGLDVPEVCANCGHEQCNHEGGTGRCRQVKDSQRYSGGDRCGCDQYLTRQAAWNQATLETNRLNAKEVEQLRARVADLTTGETKLVFEKIMADVISSMGPAIKEMCRPAKKRTRSKR